MFSHKISLCKNIIDELETSALKHGNKAFIKNCDKFYFMMICEREKSNEILIICSRIKLIGKLVCDFAFNYDLIIKENLRKEILAEKYLYSCDCCWRHSTNKGCEDFKKSYTLNGLSKEKCDYVGCHCPCRHLYRKILWIKESKKLVLDCPDYNLYDLWLGYDSKRLF